MLNQRSGVSLIETLVAVSLIVALATAFLPNLLASTDRARAQSSALVLEELTDAITTARFDNQDWPALLSHLTVGITTEDANICGELYRAGKVNNWDGPYHDRVLPSTGLPLPIGTVNDTLVRVIISGDAGPPGGGGGGGGAVALLKIVVEDVAVEDARELNRVVDADDDPAAGTIRWSGLSGGGLTTVEWVRTIKGC